MFSRHIQILMTYCKLYKLLYSVFLQMIKHKQKQIFSCCYWHPLLHLLVTKYGAYPEHGHLAAARPLNVFYLRV